MRTPKDITVAFVRFVPEKLVELTLYVSMEFATASHLCFCGCGNKVVTPLSPTDWQLYFDGRTVSLTPSVGSWDFPCRSHYWIRKSQVHWAASWTGEQVADAARLDDEAKRRYFAEAGDGRTGERKVAGAVGKPSLLARLRRWFGV